MTSARTVSSSHNPTRRDLLTAAGSAAGLLRLGSGAAWAADVAPSSSAGPVAPRAGHHPAKAKSIIWLYMEGGPSACDTFDPKPELDKHHGKRTKSAIEVFFGSPGPIMKSPFAFKQHGQCGAWVSELFPAIARHVDDICFIKSCFTESPNHGPAMYQMNTGSTRGGFPSAGAWTLFGRGTENQDLPGFVVFPNARGSKGGPNNWHNGFLPGSFQATPFRGGSQPILNLRRPSALRDDEQRALLDYTRSLNDGHAAHRIGAGPLRARSEAFELGYRMQSAGLEVADLSKENWDTQKLYGLDDPVSRPFGEKCLMARRLVERGVRFVQVYCNDEWDSHNGLRNQHSTRAAETDRGVAGLLADLKRRGLLESTLVVWGGEFGRMPVSEQGDGRDHNPHGFLVWLAGGGVKGGISHGESDELAYKAARDRVSVNDLHATMLHLLGLDHRRLTYRHNGRDYRLTDVAGEVINRICA